MKHILILVLITLLLSGCVESGVESELINSLTNEQKKELYQQIIKARLQDGWDETSWTVVGVEVLKRRRERDINTPEPSQ